MKSLWLWIVIVVVVVGGGYWWWQSAQAPAFVPVDTSASTQIPTAGTNDDANAGAEDNFAASVASTNDGFSPATVTVKKGQTVRFLNASDDQNVWPASAVHPTHSVYPEKKSTDCLGSSFDACRGLIPGEMWDFTFTQVGTWKYHDHLHPTKFGTVVVTE